MIGRVFTIGTLFALARRASREAKMETLRANTEVAARAGRQSDEKASREKNLQRMRANSSAQMQMGLADAGVSPMLTMGGGAGGGTQAAHIQQAAANNAVRGPR